MRSILPESEISLCYRSISRFSVLALLVLGYVFSAYSQTSLPGENVTLSQNGDHWELQNGVVKVSVNEGDASVGEFHYRNTDFISNYGRHNRIYWSMDGGSTYQNPSGAKCFAKTNTPEMADVGCLAKYDGSMPHAVDIEIHYVLRRGMSGVYAYAILRHPAQYPETHVGEWRMVWPAPMSAYAYLRNL